jgi:hypothetical protein
MKTNWKIMALDVETSLRKSYDQLAFYSAASKFPAQMIKKNLYPYKTGAVCSFCWPGKHKAGTGDFLHWISHLSWIRHDLH